MQLFYAADFWEILKKKRKKKKLQRLPFLVSSSVMRFNQHLDVYLNSARILTGWLKPLGVLLHNPAICFYRALIHIMVSQWIPRGGSDVWGILKKVRDFSTNETMCKNKTWRAEQKNDTTDQVVNNTSIFWLRQWVKVTYLAHGNVSLITVCGVFCFFFWWRWASEPSTMTTLELRAWTPLLRTVGRRYPSAPCLSKPRDTLIRALSANLPPSPVSSLCQGRINKTVIPALRTNAAWKDEACLNSQEQKPHIDIHLHILTLPRQA